MTSRVRRTALAVLTASLVVVALPANETVAGGPADADVVATAHADAGMAQRLDVQSEVGRLSRSGQARATATSSALCTGCEGDARTVQVVYADAPRVMADNVAAAWASCVACSASSISVQVVLVGKHATDQAFTNRSLAVNAACAGCETSALAVQFVIAGGNRPELTQQARSFLEQLATQLSLDLEMPGPGRRSAEVTSDAPGASSLTRLAATAPEARAVAKVADALRREHGRDAVTVNLDVRYGGQ